MTANELLRLGRLYAETTHLSLHTVSVIVTDSRNNKLFWRLENGFGINSRSRDAAADWFALYWPEGAEWPSDIARPVIRPCDPDGDRRMVAASS